MRTSRSNMVQTVRTSTRMPKWNRFTLKFYDEGLESGFLQYCAKSVLTRARMMGICVLFAHVGAASLRLHFFATPWDRSDDSMRKLSQTYFVLMSCGFSGCIVLVFLPFLSKCLNPIVTERVVLCAACSMLLPTCAAQHYLAAAHGIVLQEDTCLWEGDSIVVIPMVLLLTAVHMLVSIRWFVLLPSQFFCMCLYTSLSLTLGLNQRIASVNILLLGICVACISLASRELEKAERSFFLTVIKERTLRTQAEFELSKASVREPSATAVQSVTSASWLEACTNVTAQFETVQHIGRSEQWLIREEELQVAPTPLGEGAFSLVLRGQFHKSPVAIKVHKMQHEGGLASIANELRILRTLRHPNIVLFHGACVNELTRDVAVVLELCTGANMVTFVRSLGADGSKWACLLELSCLWLCVPGFFVRVVIMFPETHALDHLLSTTLTPTPHSHPHPPTWTTRSHAHTRTLDECRPIRHSFSIHTPILPLGALSLCTSHEQTRTWSVLLACPVFRTLPVLAATRRGHEKSIARTCSLAVNFSSPFSSDPDIVFFLCQWSVVLNSLIIISLCRSWSCRLLTAQLLWEWILFGRTVSAFVRECLPLFTQKEGRKGGRKPVF